MPIVSIRHRTTYRYRNPVAFGEHRVMYRPLESLDQRVIQANLDIGPEPALLRHVQDASGAVAAVARFASRARQLEFESQVTVAHTPGAAFDLETDRWAIGGKPFAYDRSDAAELARDIAPRHPDPEGELAAWTRRFLRPVGRTRLTTLFCDMTNAIRADFTYGRRLEGPPQAPTETLARRGGSCRDYAVLLVEAARSLGLAARFTSGYVYSSASQGRIGGGHTHAWARVYLPDCGWTDFDPTNGIIGNHDLIRVAEVADPRSAVPLHGTWAGLSSDFLGMDVEVEVSIAGAAVQPASHLRVAQGR